MKKFASILCAAAMATVMLAGCSSEVGGTSEPQTSDGGSRVVENLGGDPQVRGLC